MSGFDAVVVGSGPNGLSAAIVLAQAGQKVVVFEAESLIGGGARSAELTLPGFTHDICSAVHPTALASPFFRTLPLERYGLEWIQPPVMVAHPQNDGSAAIVERSIETTARGLSADVSISPALLTVMPKEDRHLLREFRTKSGTGMMIDEVYGAGKTVALWSSANRLYALYLSTPGSQEFVIEVANALE